MEPVVPSAAFGTSLKAFTEAGLKGCDKFALNELPSGNVGLAATASLRQGDEVLRVPLHLCLTGRLEDAPPAMRPALEMVAPAEDKSADSVHKRLCARLWLERLRPSSAVFAAWLPALEAAAVARREASALHWSDEALSRCGALSCVSRFVEVAQEDIESLRSTLSRVSEQLPEICAKAPDSVEAEWIHFTCQAHCLDVRDRLSSSASILKCLVPIFDAAHTGDTAKGAMAELVTGTVIVSTVSDLKTSDQILCARGACTNEQIAVSSGTAFVENAAQQVVLSLAFGALRQEQLTVLKDLGLDQFLRADENGRAIVSIVLRRCDPFPNVAVVLARVLTGSESSPHLQKSLSAETFTMDQIWLPTLLNSLKAQLQQYPIRDSAESASPVADTIYDSSREVLKAAVGTLLEMLKKIAPHVDAAKTLGAPAA